MKKTFFTIVAASILLLTGCAAEPEVVAPAPVDVIEMQNEAAVFTPVPTPEEWGTVFDLPAVPFPVTESDYKKGVFGQDAVSTVFSLSLQEDFLPDYTEELTGDGWKIVLESGEYPEQVISFTKTDAEFEYTLNVNISASFYDAEDGLTYNVTALHVTKNYL